MAISYEEQVGSCTANIAKGGSSATRIFTVAWLDAFPFATELYGRYISWPDGEYHRPARFPYIHHLYCTNVKIDGVGIASESSDEFGTYITYDKAKLTVQYATSELVDDDDPEIVEEESVSVSHEVSTTEEGAWEWTVDSVPSPNSALPGIVASVMQFSVTRYHVSSLPDYTIAGLCGKLNNAEWRTYEIGRVLFMGAEGRRSITVDGAEDWEMTYIFNVKPHHWNHAYRSQDTHEHYEAVQVKDGTDTLYQLGAFSGLGV